MLDIDCRAVFSLLPKRVLLKRKLVQRDAHGCKETECILMCVYVCLGMVVVDMSRDLSNLATEILTSDKYAPPENTFQVTENKKI